jgi:hypothetical protein
VISDCRWEGNIYHCTGEQHVCGGIDVFNSSARWVFLFYGRIVILHELTKQTTIIVNVTIYQSQEMVRTDTVAVGFIVLLVARIVDEKSIRGGRTTNDDPVHGMSLVLGTFLIPILLVIKVTHSKKGNPGAFVVAKPMDK